MSRLGKRAITLPKGVEVKAEGTKITVKGKGGTLTQSFHRDIKVAVEGNELVVTRPSDSKRHRELHGLTRALLQSMVTGVSEGFKKELTIIGVGWNAKPQGKGIVMQIGFCHTVPMTPPEGVKVELTTPQEIVISGIDAQAVGQFAADIRRVRPPEPYKGKGIRYKEEFVARKEGKSQVGK